jgi:3'-5' exonuclease
MLNQKPLNELVLLDLETTSQYPSFNDIDKPLMRELFYKRFEKEINETVVFKNEDADAELKLPAVEQVYNKRAPLLAEFGKIIAISIGILTETADGVKLTTLNLSGDDEKTLLTDFVSKTQITLCGATKLAEMKHTIVAYNGLNFDIPYIAKRLLINGLKLPVTLDISGLRPWNINWVIDPCDHWAMTSWNNHTSLDLLCAVFGVESSKTDMDGTDVKDVYWKEKNLKKISEYCERDIVALAKVYLKMQGNGKELIK